MPKSDPPKFVHVDKGRLVLGQGAVEHFAAGGSLDASAFRSELKSLPPLMTIRRADLSHCLGLTEFPVGWKCRTLDLSGTPIRTLPAELWVSDRLNLTNCTGLTALPAGLRVSWLSINGCAGLTALPEGMAVDFLDIRNCPNLREWPESALVTIGHVNARGCGLLTKLPSRLGPLSQLDVADCPGLTELPEGLEIGSWLDVGGSGITRLPASLRGVPLRWRGVPVDERTVFRPEELTAAETLGQRNAEVRRVMMERMGLERFITESKAETRDADTDPGGVRKLLRVEIAGDEDLVCLMVSCPSTARLYTLRVPPATPTCRHAAAWIAGFDDPDDYRPIIET